MKRHRWAVAALLLTPACRVEATPEEYFDRQSAVQSERESAAAEVRDRVLAMGQALGRGDAGDALAALSPAREVYFVGPGADSGSIGAPRIATVLDTLAAAGPSRIAITGVEVSVGPRGNVAWFRTVLGGSATGPRAGLRMTGVYVLNEGVWELVQAHLSAPVTDSLPTNQVESDADSAAGG